MSVTAAEAVVPGSSDAPTRVVTDVNDHTPDPETPTIVEPVPDPPVPVDGLAELRDVVATLATAVAILSERVTAKEPDESPVHVPWTHKGGPVRNYDNDEDE
jgi:hypothetical protein